MRTLLLSMLLVAAPAVAEPHDRPTGSATIDLTELAINGGGGVDPTIMRRAFDDTIDAAYRCYDSVQPKPAKLSATVTLKFRIDSHGAVTKASAVGLPSVNNCIATAIKALSFDPPNHGAMELTEKLSFSTPRTAGILGSTAGPQGGAFASLTGTGDISGGFDDPNLYGGLLGHEAGEMNGGFGYGIGGVRGARAPVPMVSLGQPGAQGDLDKAIIRRYIKRNLQKIQYCYEKELMTKPRLAGTVQTQFTIGGDGKVTSSTGAGLDPAVASCVANVIHQIEFPKPKNNGIVNVNYPFVFRWRDDDKKP